jgi:superfamily I DNA/RNA helicase
MATLHRVKGLEFDFIFVVGVNDGIIPLSAAMAADNDFDRAENEIQERALLYVAGTRARQRLFVSSSGFPSTFL